MKRTFIKSLCKTILLLCTGSLLQPLAAQKKATQAVDPRFSAYLFVYFDVFTDPQTGKSYFYWGNGYMAGAELNEDMVSLKEGTTLLRPGKDFREGSYVFYRRGKYYFLWSEDDTRSPNYRVGYGIADASLGKIVIPEKAVILSKVTAVGIYGTGHNSVLQLPGTDEWYIVYQRFNYPKGITMGSAAGYNREVCIDKLEFNDDGTIKPVKPTHEGIQPVVLKTEKMPGKN